MIRRDQIHLSLARLYARCSLYVVLATIPNSILPGPSKRLYVYLPEPSVFCVAPGSSPQQKYGDSAAIGFTCTLCFCFETLRLYRRQDDYGREKS